MKTLTSILVGLSVATATSLSFAVEGANAFSLVGGTSCSTANLTGTTNCEGIYKGNDSEIESNTSLFGSTGWTELFKVDSSSGTAGNLTTTASGSQTSGTWSLSNFDFNLYESVMFVLKGGNTFTAYLSDLATTSGIWDTDDLLKGNGSDITKTNPGLSHFTVWGIAATPDVPEVPEVPEEPVSVPEPSVMLGLLAIGGAMGLRRRR
jgi:hypothetical protein